MKSEGKLYSSMMVPSSSGLTIASYIVERIIERRRKLYEQHFEIAKRINIDEKFVIPFGNDKAKISLDILETLKDHPNGKLVLVTAITPTKAGEGKQLLPSVLHDG